MHVMNLASFDLNLLTVFDAVMQERSVTRAGNRIGLSQPAMSHALNRLRYVLKDDLFIRTPDGMIPTPHAEMLAKPLRNALAEMLIALEPAAFDPATSDKRFVLALNNYASVVLAPPLVTMASATAPKVLLDLRPSGTLDIADRLDHGDLDLTLGSSNNPGERFMSAPLLDDPFVMVMRQDHPAGQNTLSAETLAAFPHLEISSSDNDTSFIDRWFGEHGLVRHRALRAPHLSAARILVQSDLVATLSRRIAQEFIRNHPLRICELPCGSPHVRTVMQWHKRLDHLPAHRWLRDLVVSVTKTL